MHVAYLAHFITAVKHPSRTTLARTKQPRRRHQKTVLLSAKRFFGLLINTFMSKTRIEFCRLRLGHLDFPSTIDEVFATDNLTAAETAVRSKAAPAFSDSYSYGHARVTNCGASPILALVGGATVAASPTSNAVAIPPGATEVLPCKTGERVSVILY